MPDFEIFNLLFLSDVAKNKEGINSRDLPALSISNPSSVGVTDKNSSGLNT